MKSIRRIGEYKVWSPNKKKVNFKDFVNKFVILAEIETNMQVCQKCFLKKNVIS